MGKNDFDLDFDFEKEYGFDPKAFLGTEEYDEDIDLSEFTDEELGLTPKAEPVEEESPAEPEDEFDLDGLDLGEDLELDEDMSIEELLGLHSDAEPSEEEASADDTELSEEELTEDPEISEDVDLTSDFDGFFEDDDQEFDSDFPEDVEPEETEMDETMEYPEESELIDQTVFEDAPVEETEAQDGEPKTTPRRRERKALQMPKITMPSIFTKFFDLYFAPVLNKNAVEEPVDPNNPRRRRRKSKVQIFKEVYLPPIIACVCLILVLSFVIGSISNAIDQKRATDKTKQNQVQASLDAAAQVDQEYQTIMAEAAALAAGYDYDAAITKLDSFSGDMTQYQDMVAKRSEYATALEQLVEHQDPSQIPNLSFHVLIADPVRAFADTELGGKYNQNFVTVDEFTKILQQLYDNGYVLVDFDSFSQVSTGTDGSVQIITRPIRLPAGKKPIMLTETLVNYFDYMIDGNGDGKADANGDGFASRLVVQNGEIEAEYVDANGATQVGDYDLVPILESFIKANPDFSYQGARATLAVCGKEGIFGYRINSSYISTVSQAYYDEQVAGAKEIVQALRDKGYTLACYTFGNVAYATMTAAQIQADLQSWTSQITPVIGDVNTLVFAQTSTLSDWTGQALNVLQTTGFRYFVSNGTSAWAEANNTYLRQNRLMVTGETMQWYSSQFTGIFDPAAILNIQQRGDVPKSK